MKFLALVGLAAAAADGCDTPCEGEMNCCMAYEITGLPEGGYPEGNRVWPAGSAVGATVYGCSGPDWYAFMEANPDGADAPTTVGFWMEESRKEVYMQHLVATYGEDFDTDSTTEDILNE